MNKSNHTFDAGQSSALRSTRLRWLVALLINLPLPFVTLPVTGSDWLERQPGSAGTQALMLAVVVGGVLLIAGFFARNQAYKRHWQGDVVRPAGYVNGNTFLFIAVGLAGITLWLISVVTRYPAPTFAAAPVLIAVLVFGFPNGAPMLPAPPRIGIDEDLS